MPTKKSLKEVIMEEITDRFMQKTLDMVNQKIQVHSRNFKTPKIKNMRRHELRGDFNR
jgi:hypothetical protein